MVMKKKKDFNFGFITKELRYIIRKYIFFLVDSLFFFFGQLVYLKWLVEY